MKSPTEYSIQKALFRWAAMKSCTTPELKLLFAIPNGGQRSIITAKRLKDTGTRRGVPDVMLPVPSGLFHGMFIELKSKSGSPTPEQLQWLIALDQKGYATRVCYSWEHAARELMKYLGVGIDPNLG